MMLSGGGHLIAVIGDEDTCVGFLLGGIGEVNSKHEVNYFIVERNTLAYDIEKQFLNFYKRADIDVILICYEPAEKIREVIDKYKDSIVPAILEIPSKISHYEVENDPIYTQALRHQVK